MIVALACCDVLGLALKSNLQEKLMQGTEAPKLEVVRRVWAHVL